MNRQAGDQSIIKQEIPEGAPAGWAEVQESIAESASIALLLVDGYQPPALSLSNNNSICQTLQSSPDYVQLCDPFCGAAHSRAVNANTIIHYRCHAGLQCFAKPIQIGDSDDLVVIGGRAFVNTADYREVIERFRSGDLKSLESDDVFRNLLFADEAALDHAALRLTRAANELSLAEVRDQPLPSEPKGAVISEAPEAELSAEVVETKEAEPLPRASISDSLRRFTERIDASDPAQTYQSIVTESTELLGAERGSLMIFDETSNNLTMTAARGIPVAVIDVPPVQLGEGIAGSVMNEGRALVTSLDKLGKKSSPDRRYKTDSFISYPITIGERKVGVLNITDKRDGGSYDDEDLNTIDFLAPQIALAIERAEWQLRANRFQLMSITDPLTGLHNRRYLEARLAEELSRSKRYDYPLSFMMIDIDDFKFYNDRNGHQAGDRALEITSQCLRSALRKVDVASRYGGEEFSILLPQTTIEEAGVIADRIRRKIMSTRFPQSNSQPLGTVTVSIGLSSFSASLDSAEAIVRAADRALYHAKGHGKNRAYAYQATARRSG